MERRDAYEVIRPFSGGYRVGDVLDARDWPVGRAQQLVEQRYLRPVALPPAAGPADAEPRQARPDRRREG